MRRWTSDEEVTIIIPGHGIAFLIIVGTVSLGIGLIGIAVPGLPTTPFLLLTAACYLRSSRKLHAWLLARKWLGKLVREYHELRAMSFRTKAAALSLMTVMIGVSAFVLTRHLGMRIVILSVGAIGAAVLLLLPTAPRGRPEAKWWSGGMSCPGNACCVHLPETGFSL